MAVWQVVAQMSACERNRLASFETARVFPNDFLVAKGGPSVVLRLPQKLIYCSTSRCNKQRLTADTVKVGNFCPSVSDGLDPSSWLLERIALPLAVVSSEAADLISGGVIDSKSQVCHGWPRIGAVRLLCHNRVITVDGIVFFVGHLRINNYLNH